MWGEGFLSPGGPEEIAVILAETDMAGGRVLDIGSGLGGIDLLLVTQFGAGSVMGTDVEPQLTAQAVQLAARHGLSDRITFQCVSPGALPFADESFGLVFSKDAMVHVEDKPALYRELRRVLRPGGVLRAGDWLWAEGAETHPAVMAWLGGALHFAFTTPDQARNALMAADLSDVQVTDRSAELRASNRQLAAAPDGAAFDQLSQLVGEDQANARRVGTHNRQAALDQGQLIPCHIRAGRKP